MSVKTTDFQERVAHVIVETNRALRAICKRYAFFHISFLSLVLIVLACFLYFFSFLAESFFLGISISILFFLCLVYFVLKIYFQEQKPREFIALRQHALARVREAISEKEGDAAHHLLVANAAEKLGASFVDTPATFYAMPPILARTMPFISALSKMYHTADIYLIKECFLLAGIDEQIQAITCEPTRATGHADLALRYRALSEHYMSCPTPPPFSYQLISFHTHPHNGLAMEKGRRAIRRAIEEWRIVQDSLPSEVWVHRQLASSYQLLEMPKEAIREYEAIMREVPGDIEVMFQLGVLYFREGSPLQGLRVYERLRAHDVTRAKALIRHYGT